MNGRKVFIMNRKKYAFIRSRSGSAIVMALVVMTMLLLLGLAIVTVSMSTLNNSAADAATNDAYYAAESAITSAIEQLKYEVSAYYTQMLTAQSSEYGALFSNFFTGINSNAQLHFAEPVFAGVTTQTTFTTGAYDEAERKCEFNISSTATTPDGTSYQVNGQVYIKKVDVGSQPGVWLEIDDEALKAGGMLSLGKKNGTGVYGGNIVVGEISYTRSWLPYTLSPGYQLIVDANTVNTINDCLTYPEYSDPGMGSIDYYYTTNTNVNWQVANILSEGFSMATASGAALHIENCTIPEGTIHGGGDMHINNCTVYADVYCDGDLHVNNQSLYGDIHCRGDLEINNANVYGNVYCDGNVTFTSAHMEGSIFCDGDIDANNGTLEGGMFATGTITVHSIGITGGIVYAHTKIYAGNMSATGVFFSGGDIELTHSMSLNGAMIAKGDIFFSTDSNKYLTINYSHSLIEEIISKENNAPMFNESGDEPELNEDVFMGENITAQGRQS